jgi:uncharacterized protein
MHTEPRLPLQTAGRRACLAGGLSLLLGTVAARAQALSSPIGTPPAGATTNPLSEGHGTGVHSPLSPYAPLPRRSDVVAWSTLGQVRTEVRGTRVVQVYTDEVRALHQKTVRLQGFMMPLDPGERQRHFLLASVPLTCSFCTPGGAESIVEVRTRTPVRYTMEPVVVQGRLHVLQNDPFGFYYRITDAVGIK